MRYTIDNKVNLINLIGSGIVKRTRMYVYLGIGYSRITEYLEILQNDGYVNKHVSNHGFSYSLTDKGVRFYRVINEYPDILGKKLNSGLVN